MLKLIKIILDYDFNFYRVKNYELTEVPKLKKIVLNMGIGEAKDDSKVLDKAQEELSLIAGQKAVKTNSRKAISGFKIREGMPLGVKVTLRNKMMYEFLDRLINLSLPRVRDFRGLTNKSFDGNGNYTLGIKEQVIFPEIDYNSIDKIRSLQITIVTTAKNNESGIKLLTSFGFPFINPDQNNNQE